MERYWMNKETGYTKTTWGENLPVDLDKCVEITKEEKSKIDEENLKAWAKAYNGAV